MFYQNEDIKEEWYLNSDLEQSSSSKQVSYWVHAQEKGGLNPTLKQIGQITTGDLALLQQKN